jgi:hypothetical protein
VKAKRVFDGIFILSQICVLEMHPRMKPFCLSSLHARGFLPVGVDHCHHQKNPDVLPLVVSYSILQASHNLIASLTRHPQHGIPSKLAAHGRLLRVHYIAITGGETNKRPKSIAPI